MQALRFGLIGVGTIARNHAIAIKSNPDARLVAVASLNPERGRAFAAEHGGTWYADYHTLLESKDVDAVTVCTPHDLHAPMTVQAARAGKHVMCEKPMARTIAECDEMISACDSAKVTLGVIYQFRFDPLAQKLKKLLEDQKLGRLLWTNVFMPWFRTQEYYASAPWRGTWEHEGGGVTINQASHDVDLLLWLTGMPRRVTAQMRTLGHQIEVEDGTAAILEYPENRLGLLQATTAIYPGYSDRIEIAGTNGSALYHRGQGRLEWHLLEPREDHEEKTNAESGTASPISSSSAAITLQYKDYVAAVNAQRRPAVDGRQGRRSVELIEAIYRSARANSSVDLPLA